VLRGTCDEQTGSRRNMTFSDRSKPFQFRRRIAAPWSLRPHSEHISSQCGQHRRLPYLVAEQFSLSAPLLSVADGAQLRGKIDVVDHMRRLPAPLRISPVDSVIFIAVIGHATGSTGRRWNATI